MLRIHFAYFLLFFISHIVHGQNQSAGTNRKYNKNELQADLRFLQKRLEKTHPALYRYSPKPVLDKFFDSLHNTITQPMDEQQFLGLIMLLNAKTGDGHTMFLPGAETIDYNNTEGRFLPLSVAYIDGKLYAVENNSSDTSIEKGEEIISINGESTATLMSRLIARQIRDGYNQTYPIWILNHYFSAYYSFTYGQPSQFSLQLKNNSGALYKKQVAALTKDSIKHYRQISYSSPAGRGIYLEETEDKTTAILTIKSFDEDLLKSITIDSIFSMLKSNGVTKLILDLRDNQGGDFEPGRYLLSYLIVKPSRYLLSGEEARLIQPQSNHFTGKLIVLINGGSFSNTAIVSACLERDQRAIFIGEETGGNKHIICGKPTEIVLPKTSIRAFVSTDTFQILDGVADGRGVFPAHTVKPGIKDILSGKDSAKELALKLISQH